MSKKKRTGKAKQQAPAVLLVSYVPLLKGRAGITFALQQDTTALRAISEQIDRAPSGRVECCLWMLDDEKEHGLVLVLDQAQAIADHLKEWSDSEPAKWFKLYLKEKDGKYALVLFPEVKQSLARFKFAHLLEGGDPIESGQVQVITRPLHFVSGAGTAYSAIKGRIGKTMNLGLVDFQDLDLEKPFDLNPSKIIELGTFAVGHNNVMGMDSYLDGLIDGADKPPKYQSRINPVARNRLK